MSYPALNFFSADFPVLVSSWSNVDFRFCGFFFFIEFAVIVNSETMLKYVHVLVHCGKGDNFSYMIEHKLHDGKPTCLSSMNPENLQVCIFFISSLQN